MSDRIEIEMPDGTIIDAPAGTTQAQVMARYQKAQQPAPAPQAGLGSVARSLGSAAIRPIVKGLTGLPGVFADGTMAAWNLASGQNNQMPSEATNNLLDQFTEKPTGLGQGAEFVSSVIAGAKMPMPQVANPAPAAFMPARDALRNTALQAAQKEGYVVPPSSNNSTLMNRVLEGISGKVKLGQEAVIRNQAATDRLAAEGVGQSVDSALTPGALQAIRDEAFKAGYVPLREIGRVKPGAEYTQALDDITAAAKGAERSFPGLTKGSQEIDEVVKSLKQSEFDSADAVDAIKILREKADDAYRAGSNSLGKAYKSTAKALEKAIENELENRGESGSALLKAFRDARTAMAKTFTAEKALVGETGASSATKYAAELQSGVPLTGAQKKIGDFASQFSKYAPKPNGENFTPLGPLDVYGTAGLAAGMDSALPFAYPLTRIGLREYLLSPQGQQRAVRSMAGPRQSLGLGGSAAVQGAQGLGTLFSQ